MQTEKCPTTGRIHVQAFVQFPKRMRLSTAINLLKPNHVEICKDPRAAYNYCQKQDTQYAEGWSLKSDSEPAYSGKRTDLQAACEIVKESGVRKLAEEKPEMYVRYSTGFHRLKGILSPGKQHMPITVKYIYGPPGTGKTRMVPDGAGRVRIDRSGMVWYDDCIDRQVIFVDDFEGHCMMSEILQMTDCYTFPMRVMGGFYPRTYDTVYITANHHPDMYFPNALPEHKEAFKRRLELIVLGGRGPVLPSTSDTGPVPVGKPVSTAVPPETLALFGVQIRTSDTGRP